MVVRWLPAALVLNTAKQRTPEVKLPSWSLMFWISLNQAMPSIILWMEEQGQLHRILMVREGEKSGLKEN